METVQIKERNYILSNDKKPKRKMIPQKYLDVVDSLVDIDFSNAFLKKEERFVLEKALFIKDIRSEHNLIFELIDGKEMSFVWFVDVNMAENRYEIEFGGHKVKCPKDLYDFADKSIQKQRFSNY